MERSDARGYGRPLRLAALVLVALSLVLAGVGCSSKSQPAGLQNPTPTKEPGSAAGANSVVIRNQAFQPPSVTIVPSTEFLWTNEDSTAHTVTSGTPGNPSGLFDFSLPNKGSDAKFTFSQNGSVPYFCKIHAQMTGTINVST